MLNVVKQTNKLLNGSIYVTGVFACFLIFIFLKMNLFYGGDLADVPHLEVPLDKNAK